jgi:hypothetical protein
MAAAVVVSKNPDSKKARLFGLAFHGGITLLSKDTRTYICTNKPLVQLTVLFNQALLFVHSKPVQQHPSHLTAFSKTLFFYTNLTSVQLITVGPPATSFGSSSPGPLGITRFQLFIELVRYRLAACCP